jgi:hypothetical protein
MKAPAPGTYVGQLCSTNCTAANSCSTMFWSAEKKWISATLAPVCVKPFCAPAC